jgi:hypothetical protein
MNSIMSVKIDVLKYFNDIPVINDEKEDSNSGVRR